MSETARMLVDTAQRLFAEHCTKEVLIAAENGEWPAKLWSAVEEAGLAASLVPEERGGIGLDIADAMAALRVSARFSAPVPFAETMLASWLLSEAGLDAPPGPLTVAPVRSRERIGIARRGGGFALSGSASRVPFARHAAAIVVVAEAENDAFFVACVEAGRCKVEPGANVAREPRDTVTFPADLAGDAVAAAPNTLCAEDLQSFGATMRTVQIAGALAEVLDLTVRYAQERVQFGRPIGKFQAVQHNIAMLAAHSAAASAAADMAVEAAGDGMEPLLVGAAKARAGEAASAGAAIAHQVHGAIGFTHEHRLHFSTKRLWSWRDEFGRDSEWALTLGRAALQAGPQSLWSDLLTA